MILCFIDWIKWFCCRKAKPLIETEPLTYCDVIPKNDESKNLVLDFLGITQEDAKYLQENNIVPLDTVFTVEGGHRPKLNLFFSVQGENENVDQTRFSV